MGPRDDGNGRRERREGKAETRAMPRAVQPGTRAARCNITTRLSYPAENPGIDNLTGVFWRREGAKCKAKFHAKAGAIRESMRALCVEF